MSILIDTTAKTFTAIGTKTETTVRFFILEDGSRSKVSERAAEEDVQKWADFIDASVVEEVHTTWTANDLEAWERFTEEGWQDRGFTFGYVE